MTNITIFEPETSSSLFSSQDALRIAAVMEALADLENYEALLFNLTDDADQFDAQQSAVNEKIEVEGNSNPPDHSRGRRNRQKWRLSDQR